MNRELAGEAVAACFLGLALEPRRIAEIDEHRVDSLDLRGRRRGETEIARETEGLGEAAIAVAVRLRAEIGGKILSAPAQAQEARARAPIGPGDEQRARRLGRDSMDADLAVGQAV